MGRLPSLLGATAAVAGVAALAVVPARATTMFNTTTTTTTTWAPRPYVYVPTVTPSTIDNRPGCSHSTTATISTGTTGRVTRVIFTVEVAGRTIVLSATGSGSRWQATLNGGRFSPDHGGGTVRATAYGPSGRDESSAARFTLADCPA
ncbi:MAG TPA: hypothetical protein VHL53_00095 [Acidimicrobiia bacterium]|nr:hypothetical protein [Acidimicrobiia bacterium]